MTKITIHNLLYPPIPTTPTINLINPSSPELTVSTKHRNHGIIPYGYSKRLEVDQSDPRQSVE